MTTSEEVRSVSRAFAVLEATAAAQGACTLSDLATRSDLPAPTIHRMLVTLAELGYVVRSHTRTYTLGPRLIALSDLADRQLGSVVAPILRTLSEEVGEAVALGVLDGAMVTYTCQVTSRHSLRLSREVGERSLLHVGAAGKAVLASLSEPAITEAVGDGADAIRAELEQIRARGYAVDDQGHAQGVRGMAMAVPGVPTPMAVEIAAPTCRVGFDFVAVAVPALRRAVVAIADVVTVPPLRAPAVSGDGPP